MTLVFAAEKTEAAIKEALFAGRTAAWWNKEIAGKTEYLEALFQESVEVRKAHYVDDKGRASIEIYNTSDLTFVFEAEEEGLDFGTVTLLPDGIQIIRLELGESPLTLPLRVVNFHTGMGENLKVELTFTK
jgi:hypothetical protein